MEYCQGIEPVMQPSPSLNKGGDCFCCSLNAGLKWLGREETLQESYDRFMADAYGGGKVLSNTWPTFYKALDNIYGIETVVEYIQPEFNLEWYSITFGNIKPAGEYFRRVEGYLRSGWVIFIEYNYAGSGPYNPQNGSINHADHFAILDGVKALWEPTQTEGCRAWTLYVHLVCSAKGAYWIKLDDLLIKHGAGAFIMARKELWV
jgi:hypothetical protein